MIRLLAVVDDAPAAAATVSRLTDHDPVLVSRDPLACLGFEWTGPQPEPDGPALRRYDGLIRALMESCTVLPFRFWAVAPRAAKIDGWLAERSGDLVALIERVQGRVELAVRASVGPSGDDAGTGTGRDYLQQARRKQLGHPALQEMHSSLAGEAVDARVLSIDASRLAAAYLVDADRAGGFGRTVEAAADAHPEIRQRSVTGPWAPYSFVDLPDALGGPGGWGHG